MKANRRKSSLSPNLSAANKYACILLAAAVGACSKTIPPVADTAIAPGTDVSMAAQLDRNDGHSDAYRIRTDLQRGRFWVLARDHVRIYRASDKRLMQTVVLL